MMGGKAAAFAGIGILVTGIALLVGYAIQHSWIGPGTRVAFGLLSGIVLAGLGHFVSRKDKKLTLFARVLTGGGSALFYFTVFAAYAFYHLIGAVAAGVGLCVSALAVFGLSMVYRSQSVAVLGVLGAFITPLLIGGDIDDGAFPLVYVALINVPVILLGFRRQWQLLYNLGFVFTVIHYLVWLDWVADSELWIGLCFAVLFFLEYAALGLLKLRCEQRVTGRTGDMFRLVSASHLLSGAGYWLIKDAGLDEWVGAAFVLLALLHGALALFAYKVLTRFTNEILSFITGGLVAVALALPAQYDGEWVSLGWAIEGVVLAWFAGRVHSRILQAGAFLLGTIGILKGLLFDVSLYDTAPDLFLNARFIVGAVSAALLGVQGRIADHYPEEETTAYWRDAIWWTGVLGILLVFFADAFWVLGPDDAHCWLVTSLMLLATGATVVLFAPARSSVTVLGSILLLVVPAKLLLIDTFFACEIYGYDPVPFGNSIIWAQLAVVGILMILLQPRLLASGADFIMPAVNLSRTLNILSLIAGIGLVTLEIQRKPADWVDMALIILWTVCALPTILYGMKRRSAGHYCLGLALIGLATLKIIFGSTDPDCWLVTSLALLAAGATVVLFAPSRSTGSALGGILLLVVPVKLLLVDTLIGFQICGYEPVPFGNMIIWVQLAMVGILILLLQPRLPASEANFIMPEAKLSRMLNILSLIAGIGLITLEIQRKPADWADMVVTIFWAVCALAVILYGMKRRSAAHRYFGLSLFGLATFKVLFVDSSDLQGLERIAAFMGTGILLLILAFAYQKASAYFHSLDEEQDR